jgi:hypothetical protein
MDTSSAPGFRRRPHRALKRPATDDLGKTIEVSRTVSPWFYRASGSGKNVARNQKILPKLLTLNNNLLVPRDRIELPTP